MLVIGIRYLTGCAIATDVSARHRAEWPPHPARVFMALAAAHFQTGEAPGPGAALEWLEQQGPPELIAPDHVERTVVTQFVPVNDRSGPAKSPIQSAPGLTRNRQPRSFAHARIESDTVFLVWAQAKPAAHVLRALSDLCERGTRVGHSTSLVQMWATTEPPNRPANWLPDDTRATHPMRVAGPGTLQYLRQRFIQKPPLRPELSLWQGYMRKEDNIQAEPDVARTLFDHRLLLFPIKRIDGPYRHLDLVATLQVTTRWREALIASLAEGGITRDAMPEVITGHRGEARSEQPHVAFLPLPFVGHEHAHGGLMGLALAVPRDITAQDRRILLRALVQTTEVTLGPLGRWRLERPDFQSPPATLRETHWTAVPGGARQWASVTPVVLDRHAKAKDKVEYQHEVADSIRESCRRIGLEVPVEIVVTPVSAHLGAPASHEFPRLKRKDGSECRHTHAIVVFDSPVVGPLFLGAGRYRGYGLCRPLEGET